MSEYLPALAAIDPLFISMLADAGDGALGAAGFTLSVALGVARLEECDGTVADFRSALQPEYWHATLDRVRRCPQWESQGTTRSRVFKRAGVTLRTPARGLETKVTRYKYVRCVSTSAEALDMRVTLRTLREPQREPPPPLFLPERVKLREEARFHYKGWTCVFRRSWEAPSFTAAETAQVSGASAKHGVRIERSDFTRVLADPCDASHRRYLAVSVLMKMVDLFPPAVSDCAFMLLPAAQSMAAQKV